MKTLLWALILFFSFIAVLIQGCAPTFSDLQSARTIGKDRVEVTPNYSSVSFTDKDNESGSMQKHLGFQLAYGLAPQTDLRLRYELVWPEGSDLADGMSVVGIGPKFGILKDRIAFYIPIGRAFGEGTDDTWQLHPTMLFTFPAVEKSLDINLSAKYLLTLCQNCDDLLAFNLGAAISNDISIWAFRPEFGILLNPGESGYFTHLSFGFSYSFDTR